MTSDVFPEQPAAPMLVRLERSTDRDKPCCENLAIVSAGQGPHAAEFADRHQLRIRGDVRFHA